MCCNLETYVRVIAIVCITFTSAIIICLAPLQHYSVLHDISLFYDEDSGASICVPSAIYVLHIVSYILCFVAASKRTECLLVPFMILTSLQILLWLGLSIFVVYIGASSSTLNSWIWPLLIPLAIALILSTHFLVIVARFYREISHGTTASEEQPGIVFKPYSIPQTV